MKPKLYPLDLEAIRALDNAAYWSRYLRTHGLRQEHGLTENQPVPASLRRDLETIERAIRRVFAYDEKARRT